MAGDAGGTNPPRFVSQLPDVILTEGESRSYTFPAALVEDPDGDTLSYSWNVIPLAGGAFPGWLRLGTTSPTLDGPVPIGSPDFRVTLTVSDGQASASATFTLLTVGSANRVPQLASPLQEQAWAEGVPAAYTIASGSFTDPDGEPLSYSARLSNGSALPAWLSFDPAARVLSGTPPAGSDDLTVRLTATDPKGASASGDLLLRTPAVSQGINGTAAADTLTGTTAADNLNGLAGDDTINAGAGSDVIDGGPGNDRINGGTDSDVAVFPGSRADYLLSRDSAGLVTVADKFGTQDTLNEVEALRLGGEQVTTAGLAYQPAVSTVPANATGTVHRFYNVRDKAYFYSSKADEKDLVVRESTDPAYTPENGIWPYFYQGATFAAAPAGAGAATVYRFYNTQTGHHFFTLSEGERALVLRESSDPAYTPENGLWPFVDEGTGFLAYPDSSHAGTVPVFRFFSPSINRHFFTASTDEAQQMRQTGQWTDEGIGFWGAALTSNRAPALASALPDLSFREGQANSYQFPASAFSDADGDTLTYSIFLANMPSWLGFSGSTLIFSGTPPAGSGDLSIRLQASDGRGGSVSDDFVITTTAAGDDDYTSWTTTSGSILVGGAATGSIETDGDRDWFRVSLTGGRTYVAEMQGSQSGRGTLLDPLISSFYDSGGKALDNTSNDDINGSKNRDARVTFTPPTTATYFISAGSAASSTGTYRLSLLAADDYSQGSATTGAVAPGGSATGSVDNSGDRDWFKVTLTAGSSYTIDLEGALTSAGTLADPYLYGVFDSGGKVVSNTSNNDVSSGTNLNARVVFTPSSSGTYYIDVGANGSGTGGYRLSVSTGSKTGSVSAASVWPNGGDYLPAAPSAPPAGSPVPPVVLTGLMRADSAGPWDVHDAFGGQP